MLTPAADTGASTDFACINRRSEPLVHDIEPGARGVSRSAADHLGLLAMAFPHETYRPMVALSAPGHLPAGGTGALPALAAAFPIPALLGAASVAVAG